MRCILGRGGRAANPGPARPRRGREAAAPPQHRERRAGAAPAPSTSLHPPGPAPPRPSAPPDRSGAGPARCTRRLLTNRGAGPLPAAARSPHLPGPQFVRGGRGLWRSSAPTPLPGQGHLEQVAQERVQVGNVSREGGSSSSALPASMEISSSC